MKMIIAIALALAASPAIAKDPDFPALTGRVVDAANEIPDAEEAKLSADLKAYTERSGHQMVVVTVPDLGGMDKADYAYKIGRFWGIGRKGVDDGIVLLQSPGDGRPGSGKVYIAVGYGLEYVLTDAGASTVINEVMLPILKGEPGTSGEGLDKPARVAPAIIAGADEIMRISALTREQKAEFDAREKAARAAAWQRTKDGFANFLGLMLSLATLGGLGFGAWRLSTRKERAAKRAAEAEAARLADIARAERQRLADEAAERAAEERRQAAERARQARESMLAAMTPERREAFLADERRQQEAAAAAEAERQRRARAAREEQERLDAIQRRKDREEEESRQSSTIVFGGGSSGGNDSPSDNFSGGGGSFGGGGAGGEY